MNSIKKNNTHQKVKNQKYRIIYNNPKSPTSKYAQQKTNVKAKQAYVNKLNANGFAASVTGSPADITAEKGGVTWYFEIKMTCHADRYFGAATQTEWRQAFKDPDHFRFVVIITDEADENYEFIKYAPAEFMAFSTIPFFAFFVIFAS